MRLVTSIDLFNATFAVNPEIEVARILRDTAEMVARSGIEAANCSPLHDSNGNMVGEIYLEDDNA